MTMETSTPDSKKPLTGSLASPEFKSSHKTSPPRYNLTPKSSIWGSQPMLIYTKGHNSLPRKLPITDSTETEIMMRDEGSTSSASSDPSNSSWSSLIRMRVKMGSFVTENKDVISKVLTVMMLLLYCAYFVWAVVLDYQRAVPLIVITAAIVLVLFVKIITSKFGRHLNKGVTNIGYLVDQKWHILQWLVYPVLFVCVAVVIGYRVWDRPENLVSLAGLVFFILLLWTLSRSPSQVRWRPVLWGLGLQFCLAMFIQWQVGYQVFHFLGQQVQTFLSYTDHGAKFVFGKNFEDHAFAFKVLPVIIFFSCTISVLYHVGVMQRVVGSIAWVMRVTLGTTAAESLSAAGNIFVGQTEAPILIRPYLELMTRSELHAVMTGGFATIAGGVLAAYILFGIPAEHLICASVMNAPCALAVSKLFYPETEESKLGKARDLPKQEKTERNMLEAAAAGASAAVMLVANVAANLIAFLALLAFVNAALAWLGSMVDYPELSFQLACSYVFMPVAYLMGVDWEDANKIGELLGVKIFLNEFVAYSNLGVYIDNREACVGPTISVRSEVIATYALCGFANLSSIGIQLGGIGPMAPSRKGDLASVALRALAAGTITSLITACIAGLLIVQDPVYMCDLAANVTEPVNITSILNATELVNTTVLGL